ncbi:putative uncharacterized protein DDB_G0282499 [Teleopsis dalmanni]|uniref:putative uncharacterized protein DDB_G0282499 n=1 Tax=Teleopsis dalmanni TaxID=139649 RepID=UPI0018CE5B0D|nr:putative uncharacterized protein DDB_G0282499 [Teleopsis dalmanni]
MNLDVMPSSSNINSNMEKKILSSDSVIRRYTRSSLYLLRNDSRSQKRPECSLRYELQMLGLWKTTFLQNDVTNESANQSSIINFVNDRSFRSNASNNNNSSQLSTYLPTNTGFHNNQKTYIDHRSISSAHLMPAFAKRRIIANCPTPNYMSNPRSECINESKDPNYIKRQVIKERTFENHQRSDISNISPKKKSNAENDVDQCSEQEASPSLSLLSTTPSKTPNNGNQERRIGSGRLLSRDISWDYKGQDKDRTIPVMNKEISLSNNQLNQKRNILRYNERIERRAYDRNLIESGEKIESFKNDILKAGNTRYMASNESIKLDYTSNRQLIPGRNRRNHFNERKTEPEWFSEGPTSKLDTIELRGFEEIDDDTGIFNNANKSEATDPDDDGLNSYIEDKELEENDDKNLRCLERNISDIQHTKKNILNENNFVINNKPSKTIFEKIQHPKKNEAKNKSTNNFSKSTDINNYNSNDSLKAIFNFENFLSIDSLEHTIMSNDQHKNFDDFGNSRFTQWFANKRDQPQNNSTQCDKNGMCYLTIAVRQLNS